MAVADHVGDLKRVVDVAKTFRASYAGTFAADIATVASSAAGDTDGRLSEFAKNRFGLTAAFAVPARDCRIAAAIILSQLGRTLNRNDINIDDPVSVLHGLRKDMLANSKVFLDRGITHGSVSHDGSNTGNGLVIVHTSDDYDKELQNVTDETLTFTCTEDATQGVEGGSEVFEVRGELPARDVLEIGGSDFGGAAARVTCVHAGTVQHIANANFSQAFSGSGTDKIPGWTIGGAAAANVTANTTTYYRTATTGTSQSIQFAADGYLTQAMEGLPDDRPVAFYFHYNRDSSAGADTLVKITVGGASAQTLATLAGAADSAWYAVGTVKWPRQWSGGRNLKIEVDDLGGGEHILFGEVVIMPMVRLGGRWFAIKAGSTDWAIDDFATQDTQVASTGLIVDWLYRWFGVGDAECPNMPTDSAASAGYEDPT